MPVVNRPPPHHRLWFVASLLQALCVVVVSAWINTNHRQFQRVQQRRFLLSSRSSSIRWPRLHRQPHRQQQPLLLHAGDKKNDDDRPSGSFFYPVPVPDQQDQQDEYGTMSKDNDGSNNRRRDDDEEERLQERLQQVQEEQPASVEALLRNRQRPSRALQPSTINGVPSDQAGMGFALSTIKDNNNKKQKKSKPYVAIGPVLNDVTKPEYDDQGYTLYADETTGKRSRVFEALVDYPCLFTIKIVGATQGGFLPDMLSIVAAICHKDLTIDDIRHTVKRNGKWTSITVQAPVENAAMLYQLYENIDKDPRVRFKF
jgi:putative lipoic acid-binding regulatory protein